MKKTHKFSSYMKTLIEVYIELRAKQMHGVTCRMLDHSKNEKGICELLVQMIGKNIEFKTTPEAILADDAFTDCFSQRDIRTITYLAHGNIKRPQYEILGQKFVRGLNKFFFRLRDNKTGTELDKSAEEISGNVNLLGSLDSQDAHKIGYVTANEQAKNERIAVLKLKSAY